MTLPETREEAKKLGVDFKNSDTKADIQKKIDAYKLNQQLKKGNVSDEQIKLWKKKHKEVTQIFVKISEEDIAYGYLKKPSRDHKAIAVSMYAQHQLMETGEFLLDNCWLGGDDRLLNDEDARQSASIQARNIVNFLVGGSQRM